MFLQCVCVYNVCVCVCVCVSERKREIERERDRRLVEAINRNSEMSIRDQVCPLGLCTLINCFDVSLVSHC